MINIRKIKVMEVKFMRKANSQLEEKKKGKKIINKRIIEY